VRATAILVATLIAAPATAQTVAQGAGLVAGIRLNDCATVPDGDERVLPRLAMDPWVYRFYLDVLINSGDLAPSDDFTRFNMTDALCRAGPEGDAGLFATALATPPDLSLFAVNDIGGSGARGQIGLHLMRTGCTIDLTDGAAAKAALAEVVAVGANVPPLSAAARTVLDGNVDAFLAAPGPAYLVEPGRLTLRNCTS